MNRKIVVGLLVTAIMFGMNVNAEEAEIGVGEGEVVTIWECNWGGEEYESALQKLAQEATEANIDGKGYRVEVSMIPWDSFYETFMTAVVAGTAPDIACEASTSPYMYAQMGETLDLTPIYDAWLEEGNSIVEEIPESAWALGDYNGDLISIPFSVNGFGMIYRKDIFEDAGVEKLPTTWNEFLDVCEKIKAINVEPLVFKADESSSLASAGDALCISNGTGIIDTDYNSTILSDANQETYAFISEMYQNGYIPEGILGYAQADVERMFLNGEAAIYLTGLASFVPEDMLDKVGVMQPIHGPSSDVPYTTASYQFYYAFDQSGHPEATRSVLKWWMENNDLLWTEGGNGTIPSRKSQMDRVISNQLVVEFAQTWCLSEYSVSSIFPLSSFAPFSSALDAEAMSGSVLESIFSGGDYVEASEKVSKEIEALVAEY